MLIKSQCAWAPACSLGVSPPCFTSSFSSGVFPLGTKSCGRLGNCTMVFCNCNSTSAIFILSGSNCVFKPATSFFKFSACSFSPLAISPPISLEAAFTLACISSKEACNCFLSSSMAITVSTKSKLAKCLIANFCLAISLFWRKKLTCNIGSNFSKDNQSIVLRLDIPYLCLIN